MIIVFWLAIVVFQNWNTAVQALQAFKVSVELFSVVLKDLPFCVTLAAFTLFSLFCVSAFNYSVTAEVSFLALSVWCPQSFLS